MEMERVRCFDGHLVSFERGKFLARPERHEHELSPILSFYQGHSESFQKDRDHLGSKTQRSIMFHIKNAIAASYDSYLQSRVKLTRVIGTAEAC